jgi:hypothetical protein
MKTKIFFLITIFAATIFTLAATPAKKYYDPTPQAVQSLVEKTMALNPWPAKAIPPGSCIKIPTPDGNYTICYIGEKGNHLHYPCCYWEACENELRCRAILSRRLAADKE